MGVVEHALTQVLLACSSPKSSGPQAVTHTPRSIVPKVAFGHVSTHILSAVEA